MRYIIVVSNIIDNKPNGTMTSLGVLSLEFFWLAHDEYLICICSTCTRKNYTNAHTYTVYTWTQIDRRYYPKETPRELCVFYIFLFKELALWCVILDG